jgi:menaquinone-dependent protoporphyrinogen IX oxidase
MSGKILVIYSSKYGTTKKYAEWIAEKCEADILSIHDFEPAGLANYNTVIFGGSVYKGKIRDVNLVVDNWDILKNKKVAVFVVTAAPPCDPQQDKIFQWNIPNYTRDKISYFKLQGAYDYKTLDFKDKLMMMVLITFLRLKAFLGRDRKAGEQLRELSQARDWTDENAVLPIVEYARKPD